MSGRPVAGAGDVTATAGTMPFTGATSGSWTAGPVTSTAYPRLSAAGIPVVYRASCTFQFSGTNGQSPVTGTETVTLTATGAAKLQRGGSGVLLDGDVALGAFGNKVTASSARRLRTS